MPSIAPDSPFDRLRELSLRTPEGTQELLPIVDFLEITENLYQVNDILTSISHKVGSGIAIVALQKKVNAVFGRGQEFGLEKPKLYLSMDKGRMTIVKGKSWVHKNADPNGLKVEYHITDGCQFKITKPWERPNN